MILPKRLMDFLRSRRFRIALACSPFAAIVLLVLAWLGINWYGQWKFDRTVDELVARGFPRTMTEAIGPIPADEENLLLLPLVDEERRAFELYREERKITEGSWGAAMGIFNIAVNEIEYPEREDDPDIAWADLENFSDLEGHEKARALLARVEFAEPKRKALMEAMSSLRPGIADQAARNSNGDDALSFLDKVMISLISHGTLSLAAGSKNEAREDFLVALRFAKNSQTTALPCVLTEGPGRLVPDCLRGSLMEPPPGMWTDEDLQEFDAVLKDTFDGELTMRFQRMHLPLLFELAGQTHRHPPQRIDWKEWSQDWQWNWDASLASLREAWNATRPQGLRDLEWAEKLGDLADLLGDPRLPTDWRTRPPDPDKFHGNAEEIAFEMMGILHVINGKPSWDAFQNWGEGVEIETTMWRAMARWSIALDRHLLRHGAYPYSLEDLDGDLKEGLPPDPLSKATFLYRKSPKGGFELEGTQIHPDTGKTCIWERNLPE